MIINHNLSAEYAHRQFKVNQRRLHGWIEKLSSGVRINRAGDDPSGMAVSQKMQTQIRGLRQAYRNVQDGISLIQVAEGWLSETITVLKRMRDLAVQSANGTYTYSDRKQIQVETMNLVQEIDKISSQAEFNTMRFLRGALRREPADPNYNKAINPDNPYDPATFDKRGEPPIMPLQDPAPVADPKMHDLIRKQNNVGGEGQTSAMDLGGIYLHVGANMDQRIKVQIENMSSFALGLTKNIAENGNYELLVDYSTQDGSNRAIGAIDTAIYLVSREQANLGAIHNRLEFSMEGLDIATENLQAAESRIRDFDMAKGMVDFVKDQVLTQSAASLLAHANLQPQVVLKLLA